MARFQLTSDMIQVSSFGVCDISLYQSLSDIVPESSSRIYSPEVFAIAQLLGEIPYSVLCAIVYWALMVSKNSFATEASDQHSRYIHKALVKERRGPQALGSSYL